MRSFIIMLGALFLIYLVIESLRVRQSRQTIEHIIHVNGTRGKSTVTRLIDAGLRAGGLHVYCKTTGTDPMTIDVNGIEAPVVRHGPANIREQISILCRATKQQAQVLVIECMAVHPELQYAAQHQILKADIGVLTNVRIDHTDVMGESVGGNCTCFEQHHSEAGNSVYRRKSSAAYFVSKSGFVTHESLSNPALRIRTGL